MSEKKIELAGVWRDWETDPPEERHGDSEKNVLVRWQDAGDIWHTMLPWHNNGKRHLCDWLDTTPEALQVDNGDGTVTLYGVPVTVPAEILKTSRLKCVQVMGRHVGDCERVFKWDFINPPSWKPMASLPDGVYTLHRGTFLRLHFGSNQDRKNGRCTVIDTANYRDFAKPPCPGFWRVTNGEAEYLGTEWEGGAE